MALQRFAAKLAGLYPEDTLQALIVDEAMDTINELAGKAPQGGTDEEKKEKRRAYQTNEMTKFFGLIESRIQHFGGGTTICGVPSVADLHLMVTVQGLQSGFWDFIDVHFFKDFPGITACVDHIAAHVIVKAYYDSLEAAKNEKL